MLSIAARIRIVAILLAYLLYAPGAEAQLPYYQSFKDTSAPGVVLAGAAVLTAKTADAPGTGYLRLTDTLVNQVGCVYAKDSFPSTMGIVAAFEFFTYARSGSTPADGFSFFLFDASVNAFRAGPTGGSLGYAQKYATPGLGKGYIGIGVDEFGNFSVISDGNKNGGTSAKVKPAVVIRGPGNGASATDYPYITGVQTDLSPHTTPFNTFYQRYPDSSSTSYRRIKIIMKPGSSLGTAGYKVTIVMYKGAGTAGLPVVPDTLINNFDYPYVAPARLQYGLIASTGSAFAFHEIRNMRIEAYNALTAPILKNDTAYVCSGNQALIDVAANDLSTNSNGTINKASIDLDPATSGIQTTFSDPGKGDYSLDASTGRITFTPATGFTGTSAIAYTAQDNYGAAATSNGTLSVIVSSGSSLTLAVTDPAGICGSGTVSITAPAVTAGSTSGLAYSYYSTLADAAAATNNINSTAGALSTAGTYYIRGDKSGCFTTRPVNVVVSQAPTTASAGGSQGVCISSNLLVSLQANSPTTGTGAWSQVSGPATANIAIPMSSNTPVQLPATAGAYVLRWTISNGVCPASTSDVTVTVSALGTTAAAGGNHTLCGASSYTLSGNTATTGTGAWTVPYNNSGSTPVISNTAAPGASVSNLVPGSNYVFQWKISNGSCSSTSNDTLRILQSPTTATTSGDQLLSGATTVSIQGNTPAVGTGQWSQVSGPAVTIASPASASTSVSGLTAGNAYGFRWTISNGVCTPSASSLIVTNVTPLPVKFLTFTAVRRDEDALLAWSTAMEQNTDRFEVERSLDGATFTPIGAVPAQGKAEGNSYTYADPFPATAIEARRFYRIREVDYSGAGDYSRTAALLNADAAGKIAVQPNPFGRRLDLTFYDEGNSEATIELCDGIGKIVCRRNYQTIPGTNQLTLDDLQLLPGGIYLLKIYRTNGSVLVQKVLKR